MTTGQLVTPQLVCDFTINRPRTTSATANLGFHSQSSLAMWFASDDMPLNEWWYENMYKWCHESRRNYTFVNLQAMKISERRVFVLVTWPDGYRKNDRKRAVVWPWLVLEFSTVLELTQLGIRQSDWWRAGIRSTNLHIVVELPFYLCVGLLFYLSRMQSLTVRIQLKWLKSIRNEWKYDTLPVRKPPLYQQTNKYKIYFHRIVETMFIFGPGKLSSDVHPPVHLFAGRHYCPDSKVHGANMGPIWGRQDSGGPHIGPMNFAIWVSRKIQYLLKRLVHRWSYYQPDAYQLWLDCLLLYTFCKTVDFCTSFFWLVDSSTLDVTSLDVTPIHQPAASSIYMRLIY